MFPNCACFAAQQTSGNDRTARSRKRLSRTARPARPHHACAARHVAQGAGKGLRYFRTLYRPARKRQGQRLDRAVAPGVECDGRASGGSHSDRRTFAGLAGHPRPAAKSVAEPDRAGQGCARGPGRLGAAADVVCRHRPDRPARRRQIHARQDAGEEDRLEFRRTEQGDRARQRPVGRRDHRALRPGRFQAHGAGRAHGNCWRETSRWCWRPAAASSPSP